MSDEPKKRSRGGIVWIIPLLLTLYVLSDGPATWLWGHGDITDTDRTDRFNAAYAPISWLYDNCPIVRPFWAWYIRLWVDY